MALPTDLVLLLHKYIRSSAPRHVQGVTNCVTKDRAHKKESCCSFLSFGHNRDRTLLFGTQLHGLFFPLLCPFLQHLQELFKSPPLHHFRICSNVHRVPLRPITHICSKLGASYDSSSLVGSTRKTNSCRS